MKHGKQVLILETPVASSVGIVGRRSRFAWCVFQSERGPTDESGTERAKRSCGERGTPPKPTIRKITTKMGWISTILYEIVGLWLGSPHYLPLLFGCQTKTLKNATFFLAILKFYRVTSPWTSSAFLQNLSSGCDLLLLGAMGWYGVIVTPGTGLKWHQWEGHGYTVFQGYILLRGKSCNRME